VVRTHPVKCDTSPYWPRRGCVLPPAPDLYGRGTPSSSRVIDELRGDGGDLEYYIEYACCGDQQLAGALARREDLSPYGLRQILPQLTRTHAAAAWARLQRQWAPFWSGNACGAVAVELLAKLYGVDPGRFTAAFVDPAQAAASLLPNPAATGAWTGAEQAAVDAVVASGLLEAAAKAALPVGAVLAAAGYVGDWYPGTLAVALETVPALVQADAATWLALVELAVDAPRTPLHVAVPPAT